MRLAYDTFNLEEYSEIFEGKFEPRNGHGTFGKMWLQDQPHVRVDRSVAVERDLLLVLPYVVMPYRMRGSVGEGRETQ
jgi:hypothetical protein